MGNVWAGRGQRCGSEEVVVRVGLWVGRMRGRRVGRRESGRAECDGGWKGRAPGREGGKEEGRRGRVEGKGGREGGREGGKEGGRRASSPSRPPSSYAFLFSGLLKTCRDRGDTVFCLSRFERKEAGHRICDGTSIVTCLVGFRDQLEARLRLRILGILVGVPLLSGPVVSLSHLLGCRLL